MRDLEERDAGVADRDVVPRSLEQPEPQRRPQDALLRRKRHRQHVRTRLGIVGLQRIGVRLVEPRADQHVLDLAPQPLLVGQPPEHRLSDRQGRRHVLEPEARHFLDEVDVAANVARAPARRVHRPVGIDAEAEPFETVALLGLLHGQAQHRLGLGGTKADRRGGRRLGAHLALPDQTRAGE